MPHYKDGTEAKVGDRLRFQTSQFDGHKSIPVLREGVVFEIQPGVATCNARVAYCYLEWNSAADGTETRLVCSASAYVTLGDCEKADVPIAPPAS